MKFLAPDLTASKWHSQKPKSVRRSFRYAAHRPPDRGPWRQKAETISGLGFLLASLAHSPCRSRVWWSVGLMRSWIVFAHVLVISSLSPAASEGSFPFPEYLSPSFIPHFDVRELAKEHLL